MNNMQLVEYNIETAVITALGSKYKNITITDGKSYAFVMEGLRDYRELRLKIDEKHKELKADALEYGRAVDAEKNRLAITGPRVQDKKAKAILADALDGLSCTATMIKTEVEDL